MEGEPGSLDIVEQIKSVYFKYRHQKKTDIRLKRMIYVLQEFLNDEQHYSVVNSYDYLSKLEEFNDRTIPFDDCVRNFFTSTEVSKLYPLVR